MLNQVLKVSSGKCQQSVEVLSKSVTFLYFVFSPCSVETYCRWGGNLCNEYIENFRTNYLVKEFRKSVHISQSYHQTSRGLLFRTRYCMRYMVLFKLFKSVFMLCCVKVTTVSNIVDFLRLSCYTQRPWRTDALSAPAYFRPSYVAGISNNCHVRKPTARKIRHVQ